MQPKLLAEPQAEYQLTPEEHAEKGRYRQRLAEYLKDPAFRQIEGFPIGEDEAILTLSDPPYYTACPNPFLGEIVEHWQPDRQALRKELGLPDDSRENGFQIYHREPFAADVSEGKNDPIYNAHSYHTKVPHKAIMRYILHYTEPGDIVLDGFCGTGMTGVAAQLCGDKKAVESLGYTVQKDGTVLDENGQVTSRLGVRKAVLVDLSPAATFIAYNYNTPVDAKVFEREAKRILREVENECGWMYDTWHPNSKEPNRVKGHVNFTIWSEVFACPNCSNEMTFWDVGIDHKEGVVVDMWDCPKCNARLAKSPKKDSGALKIDRAWETFFDDSLGKTIRRTKQAPVLINYSMENKRYEKKPDLDDLALIQMIDQQIIPYSFPNNPLPDGEKTTDPLNIGVTHVHQFYTHRNLWTLAATIHRTYGERTLFIITALIRTMSKMFRWAPHGKHTAGMSGTLYIPSVSHEYPIFKAISRRLLLFEELLRYLTEIHSGNTAISANSSSTIKLPENSLDYIFVDPPFGNNLMYSELNFLWESWLRVFTKNKAEAIINKVQKKGLTEYQSLMEVCFREFYRLLKPGHWMTIEFHNSQNSVWNSIQEAALQSGFIVADVRTFDKQQGTFNQTTTSGAVKADLIISVYKPTTSFERQFQAEAGSIQGAWAFIRQHLEQLPSPAVENGVIETLTERQAYLLYDRMVAFHLVRGLSVPLSSPEFYQGLAQRFLERDGMYFTPAQAAEYDGMRLKAERVEQLALFVTDESSARQWLRQELAIQPASYGELQPRFVQALHQAKYEALPELKIILEQSFIKDNQGRWFVPDPDNAAHLEQLRQSALLREFNEYRKSKGRLKVFRSEAVRTGFSNAWREREYAVIVTIAERLPESVLHEDQGLLMYYHNASLRLSDQPKQAKLF